MHLIFIHVLDAQGQEDIVALNEFLACKDCISAGKGQRGPILQQSFIHLRTFSFRIIYLKEEFVLAKFGTDWRNNGFYSWGKNMTESLCRLRIQSKRHNTWLKTPSLPTFLKKSRAVNLPQRLTQTIFKFSSNIRQGWSEVFSDKGLSLGYF